MPYVNLRVKTNFPEDRWVQAFEVLPTAPEVVHHVIVFAVDTKAKGRSRPELLAAYVPGNTHVTFPEGTAEFFLQEPRYIFKCTTHRLGWQQ